jgi:NAD(P)H-flavin reductase
VASRREDTADTVTLELTEPAQPVPAFGPGQFAVLTAFGVGEVPISVSGLGDSGGGRGRRLEHTLRAVGAVTRALHAAPPGSLIGVRGPFGTGWDVASAAGRDIVIVAGGIGLAPLRPVVLSALADRSRYGRIVLLAGARTPGDLLYGDELERWHRRPRSDCCGPPAWRRPTWRRPTWREPSARSTPVRPRSSSYPGSRDLTRGGASESPQRPHAVRPRAGPSRG